MTMRWFGTSWGAPVCEPETHVPTPVGKTCFRCGEPIANRDDGIIMPYVNEHGEVSMEPWHYECNMREILGSARTLKGAAAARSPAARKATRQD